MEECISEEQYLSVMRSFRYKNITSACIFLCDQSMLSARSVNPFVGMVQMTWSVLDWVVLNFDLFLIFFLWIFFGKWWSGEKQWNLANFIFCWTMFWSCTKRNMQMSWASCYQMTVRRKHIILWNLGTETSVCVKLLIKCLRKPAL